MNVVPSSHLQFVAFVCLAMLAACDVIEDPVIPVTSNYLEAVYGPAPVFDALPLSSAEKRVVVEDFTAHQCGNCPAAAIIAEDIAATHEGLVSVMAIHAGDLATTDDEYFDTDWTTEEGNAYWDELDFQANPLGRINRVNGTGAFLAPAQWNDIVTSELDKDISVGLQIRQSWEPVNRHLNLHLHGTSNHAG